MSIALADGGGLATIEAGASEYKLHTYGADDYPELPEIDRERLFTVEREAFLEAVERVVHAASKDEARPVLTGVHLELGLGTLTVAATDSYRLAVRTTTLEGGPVEDIQAIVPARALGELVRDRAGVERRERRDRLRAQPDALRHRRRVALGTRDRSRWPGASRWPPG